MKITFEKFITDVLNEPGSPIEALVKHLSQVAPVLASELTKSSVNPKADPANFALAIQWIKGYWPADGLVVNERDLTERLGRAINVRAAELRRSMRWLHETTGISYPYIMEITKGKKRAKVDKYALIADALGLELAELVERAEALPDLPAS